MRKLVWRCVGVALAATAIFVGGMWLANLPATAVVRKSFITIRSGAAPGVYYSAGTAICRLLMRSRKEHGIRCLVQTTAGSVDTLKTIRAGKLDMGVVRSDWQFHAYNGTSKFEETGPFKDLRTVFSLQPEPFTVVARKDSGINHFNDLKGKRVSIGKAGSSRRDTMEAVMKAFGLVEGAVSLVTEFESAEQSEALCRNRIDAIVFTGGHPSGLVKEATTSCDSVIVEVSGEKIDKLVAENDYYRSAVIPGGMYRGTPSDVKTFGVRATFVSSTKTRNDTVYWVVKSVFENFDQFRKLHPAFRNLKQEGMVRDGLGAPLHDGAIRYFKEAGLL